MIVVANGDQTMVSATFLALKIAYLIKQASKNRFTLSEAKLKQLSEKKVLSITYLNTLKQQLEELGYFLGSLKKGKYCLLTIESLEGAPSLPMKEDALKELSNLSEEALEQQCTTVTAIEMITDNEQDEKLLLLNELWIELTNTATNKKVISYGSLAKKLKESIGYNVNHKEAVVLLKHIKQFCTENNLPPLTYLAINAILNLPTELKKVDNAKGDFEAAKAKIYDFKWSEQKQNFDEFLNKNKEN